MKHRGLIWQIFPCFVAWRQPPCVQPVAFNAQAQGGKLTVSVPAKAVVVVAVE